ncbi:TPA: hypothetical protein ACKE3D_002372 [Burkholderia dolosa]
MTAPNNPVANESIFGLDNEEPRCVMVEEVRGFDSRIAAVRIQL